MKYSEVIESLSFNSLIKIPFYDLSYVSKMAFVYIFASYYSLDEAKTVDIFNLMVNKYQNESFKLKGIIKSNINEETSLIDLIFSINLNDLKYFLKEDFYKLKERVKGVISLIYHSLNNHLNVGNEEENNLFHLVCKDNNDNDKNKIYRVILLFPFIEIETEIKERIINFINEIKLVEYIKIKAVFDEEIE